MKERLTNDDKNLFYILKGLAIFSVVCAHSTPITENADKISVVISEFLNYLGTMGVPIFFLVSGFLFDRNKRSLGAFWKRKLTTVVLPWIFCETMLWLYVVLRKGGITLKAWGLFVIGYEHTTYYLTVLMVLYVIFWFLKYDWQLYFVMAVSVISMICVGWDTGINVINTWTGTFYLNPLNWCAFFIIGMLLNRKETLQERYMKQARFTPLWIVASVGYFVLCMIMEQDIYYFSKYAVVAHIVNILLLCSLAKCIANSKRKERFITLGKYSFTIYLLHQFVAGIVVALSNRLNIFVGIMIRPFVIIAIVMLGIWILKKINEKCSGKLDFIESLIGIRE